jgi:hypothetical protein
MASVVENIFDTFDGLLNDGWPPRGCRMGGGGITKGEKQLLNQIGRQLGTKIAVDEGSETLKGN